MTKHGDGRARIPSTQRVEVEVAELLSELKFVASKQMLKNVTRRTREGSRGKIFRRCLRLPVTRMVILQTFRAVACRFISSTSSRCHVMS